MKINYNDIKDKSFEEMNSLLKNLKIECRKKQEILEIECQSPRQHWMPPLTILTISDKLILDGKVIKDRFGEKNENINS